MADKLLFFSTHLHLTLSHFVSGELSELLLVLYKENQYLNVIILKRGVGGWMHWLHPLVAKTLCILSNYIVGKK